MLILIEIHGGSKGKKGAFILCNVLDEILLFASDARKFRDNSGSCRVNQKSLFSQNSAVSLTDLTFVWPVWGRVQESFGTTFKYLYIKFSSYRKVDAEVI